MTILEVETHDRGEGLVHLTLRGELDLSTVSRVQDELEDVESTRPKTLVLDLSQLSFLDSTGLRCVLSADERARGEDRRLVVVKGPEAVQRVFAVTRLEERLEMVDDPSAVSAAEG